jgi:hypothetical protein
VFSSPHAEPLSTYHLFVCGGKGGVNNNHHVAGKDMCVGFLCIPRGVYVGGWVDVMQRLLLYATHPCICSVDVHKHAGQACEHNTDPQCSTSLCLVPMCSGSAESACLLLSPPLLTCICCLLSVKFCGPDGRVLCCTMDVHRTTHARHAGGKDKPRQVSCDVC